MTPEHDDPYNQRWHSLIHDLAEATSYSTALALLAVEVARQHRLAAQSSRYDDTAFSKGAVAAFEAVHLRLTAHLQSELHRQSYDLPPEKTA